MLYQVDIRLLNLPTAEEAGYAHSGGGVAVLCYFIITVGLGPQELGSGSAAELHSCSESPSTVC